jgi:non-heme chloroperoxidase
MPTWLILRKSEVLMHLAFFLLIILKNKKHKHVKRESDAMGYYIKVGNNVEIFIEDIGYGKPILMIHGWPLNSKMFEYQMNVLPAYGVRIIAPDLRGFGKSDRPFDGYSYNQMADDIKAIVDALHLDYFTLLGFSMGGAIAIRYMSRYNSYKVSKLILAGAAAPSFTMRENEPYGTPVDEVNSLIYSLYHDRPKAIEEFGEKFFAGKISDEFKTWFTNLNLEASGHGTIQAAASLRDEDLRIELSRIYVETYILHGKHDQICPFDFATQMNKHIRNSKLIPFEKSGHGLFYEEWQKFNQEIMSAI